MQQMQENRHGVCVTRLPKCCGLNIESAAEQVHQRAFWSTPQKVAGTNATHLPCMHLGSMPYRSKKFWRRAFSFSPDGFSEEAFSPHKSSGLLGARPATAAEATSPGATTKAKPWLNQADLPSNMDHSSRVRPYPVRAHVNEATQHCPLAPGSWWQIRNQTPKCIPLTSWLDPFSCPLPKVWPPCRHTPARTAQVRLACSACQLQ